MSHTEYSFNPLEHPICLQMPHRELSSAWEEHTSFAMYLMDVLRPRVFVELGTFYGVSYCAFCQAAAECDIDCSCFAVDTWSGDEHTGLYTENVLENLRRHHDPLYGRFSTLIQSTFDDAVGRFEDDSIDLLHIDGYHTYEVVKHDFKTWLPKLSPSAVILFHDTNERQNDFGVWKLFAELREHYPHFEFFHGHGLGIVSVGKTPPASLLHLFNATEAEAGIIRNFFQELGRRVSLYTSLAEMKETEKNLRSDILHMKERESILHEEIQQSRDLITGLREDLHQSRMSLAAKEKQLSEIQQSLVIHMIFRYRVLVEKFFPQGSSRRKFYDLFIKALRKLLLDGLQIRRGFNKISSTWKRGGIRLVTQKFLQKVPGSRVKKNDGDTDPVLAEIDKKTANEYLASMQYKPEFSVILPTYNTSRHHLLAAIRSVQQQYYPHWELCICDDGSTNPETKEALQSITDERIKIVMEPENRGISNATNKALKMAGGEFVALLDHDDELTLDALITASIYLNRDTSIDVIYSDQDKIDKAGRRGEPFYKPDWSPEYFRAVMYVGHLLILRRKILEKTGFLDPVYDGVQDYELMLRVSEHTSKIIHIPKILYHWRMIPGSVAFGVDEKGEKIERLQVEAVNAQLKRLKINGKASSHPLYRHRVSLKPLPREEYPLVSIVIVTKDAPEHISRCLDSIFRLTTYPNYEVVIVDHNTTDPAALKIFEKFPVRVVPFHEPFNYSRANNVGVESANGQIVILLNNDTEVVSTDWIEQMSFYLDDPSVAIVGPMLVFPNQTIQHAGVALGLRGTADHVMRGFPMDSDGYAGSLSCPRNVSAVTGACLMIRREDYLKTGGLSEYFGTHYQDVDLCLRFLSNDQRIVYVPYAVLLHHEGATRGKYYDHLDRALLLDTWGTLIAKGDPYYNLNFKKGSIDYAVE